jgi:ElaB/YqjD/DUF883 family membrane-anchored ribosome-binding protein
MPQDEQRSGSDDAHEIEELRHRIQALQSDVAHADRRLRAALRERPFVALGVAVAAGFILGRAIGRS